jgi:D-xylose transport system ATP-binding protein
VWEAPWRLPHSSYVMATADMPLLELRGVSKAFGAVQALYRVDFEVRRGEVMALVGDNGAGKSTLIKSVVGIYPFDEGEVRYDGAPVNVHGPRDAAKLGIEVVYQDLALADNLDVVANMFLGRERARLRFVLDESSMERSARETLDSLSVTTLKSVRQTVAGLSGGQRQAVAVAKSVMWDSRLVILDEPSLTTCTTSSKSRTGSPFCGSVSGWRCSSEPRRISRRSCKPSRPARSTMCPG